MTLKVPRRFRARANTGSGFNYIDEGFSKTEERHVKRWKLGKPLHSAKGLG